MGPSMSVGASSAIPASSQTEPMLPITEIRAWRDQAPWADDDDVEQDLIITRALFDIYRDSFLAERLAIRGGTALHRLHLAPAARFSEDIDLVQRFPEGIGPTFDRIRERLGWLGEPKRDTRKVPKLWYRFITEAGGVHRKLKIEINTREHFATVTNVPYTVDHPLVADSLEIPSHAIDEMLATKLRAFTQRDKGRDLFDLWRAYQHVVIDPAEIVRLYGVYMKAGGYVVDSAPELRSKTVAKSGKGIFEEVRPLLRDGIDYDVDAALEWFEEEIIARLRNDDGTRVFRRGLQATAL